jgi:hypothetical protein
VCRRAGVAEGGADVEHRRRRAAQRLEHRVDGMPKDVRPGDVERDGHDGCDQEPDERHPEDRLPRPEFTR